ncbi:ATP-grasp domain-containing protein [Curtobacterium sp. MCBA15_004]|uniref:D-alanine--D-alanine ligase family protein n=1 Tax=unclassified Curtobacterium TaxID=257496 RepID=UPI0008DD5475|nr:ATP-grasp domain-containing protein [Curtobacterium sp. MCBA15_004]WIA96174.1 ATP-grasp domain-containing protein [Curtobacterium sp. MCBA15_004]
MPDHSHLRVAVIGGGANDEHDVSLASAAAAERALRAGGTATVALTVGRDGSWHAADGTPLSAAAAVAAITTCDAAFPLLHGDHGEDGAVAGLLDMIGVPVVGSPVRAGALAADKWVTKLVAEALGIATAPGVLVRRTADDREVDVAVRALPGSPWVVKPTSAGSSNGVTVVRRSAGVAAAVRHARTAGDAVLVESFVSGREVDVALFRDATGTLRTGAPLEVVVAADHVFDREQKYDGTADFRVPARLSTAEQAAVTGAAVALYDALGCAGVARFDFFVTDDGVVLNEVNTTPGFTERSQVPLVFAAVGLDQVALVDALLRAATAR